MEKIFSVNLDADEKVFFGRELEKVKARTYDVKYPAYKAKSLIPVSSEAGEGAETISYQQFDTVGMMKLINSYADDLPRSDIKGAEFISPVRSLGGSYGYSVQEIKAARFAGKPITAKKAEAVRRAYEAAVNKIAWLGNAASPEFAGLNGFIYNPNIPSAAVADNAGGTSKKFADKTPDEIIADLNSLVNDIITVSKGVEIPDTVLLPVEQYAHISSTAKSSDSDTTILDFFKKANPNITTVDWVNELAGLAVAPSGGAAPVDIMIAYRRSDEVLTLELPTMFEQFPAQERNLEFVVPAHGRIGGVIVYYPLACNIREGI